jgi:hypothetical protein
MASDFSIVINGIYEENGFKVKAADLRVGSSVRLPTLPSVNIKKIKSKTVDAIKEKVLIENNAVLTLKHLREMDSNQIEQSKFIKDKLKNYADNPSFLSIQLLIEDSDKINDLDIDDLIALLNSPYNSLLVPPLIYHYKKVSFTREVDGKVIRSERDQPTAPADLPTYFEFLNKFITKAKSQYGIKKTVMSVPTNISHSGVSTLLDNYKELDTPIALIDLHGKTPKSLGPQINSLTKKSGKDNQNTLNDKHGENFVLYAFDAMPYTSHQPIAPSQAALYSLLNINLFGPRHTVRVTDRNKDYKPRLFTGKEYSYANDKYAGYKEVVRNCTDWSQSIFEDSKLRVDDYTAYSVINAVKEIRGLAKNNEIEEKIKNKSSFYKAVDFLKKEFRV